MESNIFLSIFFAKKARFFIARFICSFILSSEDIPICLSEINVIESPVESKFFGIFRNAEYPFSVKLFASTPVGNSYLITRSLLKLFLKRPLLSFTAIV